jgi:dihydroorotate dehydrogenase electron transfer subunit
MEIEGVLIKHKHLNGRFYWLEIEAPGIVESAAPGQFVMVGVNRVTADSKDPLFKRPFSFYRINRAHGTFELLYKVVGRGTSMLSNFAEGESLRLLGPLGKPIILPANAKNIAVVTRGIGVAPAMAIIDEALSKNMRVYAYLSASTESGLLCSKEIEKKVTATYITTDDGSVNCCGNVTMFLEETLREIKIDAVYSCGSRRLAKHIADLKKVYQFEGWVLLEEHMACGFGACKGCVCKVKNRDDNSQNHENIEYRRVCVDGPAFEIDKVVLY